MSNAEDLLQWVATAAPQCAWRAMYGQCRHYAESGPLCGGHAIHLSNQYSHIVLVKKGSTRKCLAGRCRARAIAKIMDHWMCADHMSEFWLGNQPFDLALVPPEASP